MGFLKERTEIVRRELTGDFKYVGFNDDGYPLFYFFELEVPKAIAKPINTFLFPLVLNPDDITFEEPFAVHDTMSQGGGLVVEENGIVKRILRIRGQTGLKPRPYQGGAFNLIQAGERKSFGRDLDTFYANFSGQRHFQFLQDKVFRTYADLKQDPNTSAGTKLYWHNQKDDEHWRIIPVHFHVKRRSRVLYEYDILAWAVEPAEEFDLAFVEDRNWIDAIKDGVRAVQQTIDGVRGAIRELTALAADIKQFVNGFDNLLNNMIDIVDDLEDFAQGATSAVTAPFDSVSTVLDSLGTAMTQLEAIPTEAADIVLQSYRGAEDSFNRLKAHPEVFETAPERSLRELKRQAELSTFNNSKARLRAAAAAEPPSNFRQLIDLGSDPLPGDELRAREELGIARDIQSFKSAFSYRVEANEDLPSLAARFLGDARRWRVLAILNQLEAPYLSEQGQDFTLNVGDEILIPSVARPQASNNDIPVFGVGPGESAPARLLGTDFLLEQNSQGFYEIPVDVSGGSVDAKTVTGVGNVQQAVGQRISIERGEDPLYQELGVKPVVGIGAAPADRLLSAFRVAEAVARDPRISRTRNLKVGTGVSADVIKTEFNAELRGFSEPFAISTRALKVRG